MAQSESKTDAVAQYIYCTYIVRNGKVIYPKKAKVFRIPLKRLKKPKG